MTPQRPWTTMGVSDGAADIAEALLDTVVLINGHGGSGSGVIWTPQGLIVTNSHVVRGDEAGVVLRDGRRFSGKLVARDARHDLAALQIEAEGLPAATPGDSSRIHVGQLVLAVGNPFGMRGVVTAGIVTAVGQVTRGERTRLEDLIQADVALAPGNSGGPLADVEGRVLGINSMISSAGVALAIPVALVQAFLLPRRKAQPYLGVSGVAVSLRAAGVERGGVLLTAVEEGSPADRAGLLQGDVLVGLDGHEVESDDEFRIRFAELKDDPVRMMVLRGQEPREFTVMPATRVEA